MSRAIGTMPDGRTSCLREQAAVYQSVAATGPARSRGPSGGACAQKESAPIRRKSVAGPRGAVVSDCQGPGRSPVCGGGVGFPRLRGHHGTARVPESPTRTPPPQSPYYGLPQDHLLRRASSTSGGSQPARAAGPPKPVGNRRVMHGTSVLLMVGHPAPDVNLPARTAAKWRGAGCAPVLCGATLHGRPGQVKQVTIDALSLIVDEKLLF